MKILFEITLLRILLFFSSISCFLSPYEIRCSFALSFALFPFLQLFFTNTHHLRHWRSNSSSMTLNTAFRYNISSSQNWFLWDNFRNLERIPSPWTHDSGTIGNFSSFDFSSPSVLSFAPLLFRLFFFYGNFTSWLQFSLFSSPFKMKSEPEGFDYGTDFLCGRAP